MQPLTPASGFADSGRQNDFAEWIEWMGSEPMAASGAVAERQQSDQRALAVWRDMKRTIVAAIQAANKTMAESQRVECADTIADGLAVTRWSEYPIAFLDVAFDRANASIDCTYSFAARPGDSYREIQTTLLLKSAGSSMTITDEQGGPVGSAADVASRLANAYLAGL